MSNWVDEEALALAMIAVVAMAKKTGRDIETVIRVIRAEANR